MLRQLGCAVAATVLLLPSAARAQRDPWAGSWRGALTTPQGSDMSAALRVTLSSDSTGLVSVGGGANLSADRAGDPTNIILTLVREDDGYSGLLTGFGLNSEIRLDTVETDDVQVTVEGATETAFGPLTLVYSLTRDNQVLSGGGRVTLGDHGFDVEIELKRGRRSEVPQPQVEPRIGYFTGAWRFDYTGGEFPPLSIGTRSGTVTFTDLPDAPFVRGRVNGDVYGESYEETWTIGFDEDIKGVMWQEQLSTGQQLVAVGNWTSPIAITFLTAPVEADGRVYVLRRVTQTISDVSFTVTDEFSVDGGPFQRLGNGSYFKVR